jgi:hypothetical protein
MKKILSIILTLAVLASTIIGFAQTLSPYAFPFIGRWQPSENPLLLDDYGLQDIQNLRKDGKHFKGVSGHTPINTIYVSGASNTYPWVLNGFHFKKDQPSESHVVVFAGEYFQQSGVYLADGSVIASGAQRAGSFYARVLDSTTVIPGAGDFSTSTLYTPTAFDEVWRFSNAPAGNMVMANGTDTLIWAGAEIEATAFITSSSTVTYAVTNSNDYSEILSNNSQATGQTAALTQAASGTFLVGSKRPLQGVKLYVKTANDTASTLTGKEWTGAAWTALTLTDGTTVGGKTLATTGAVTWTYSGNGKPRYINGLSLYWYQFTFSAGSTTLYYVTTDSPVQVIRNIWDGVEVGTAKCLIYDASSTAYNDYTDDVGDGANWTYANASSTTSSDAIYLGFLEPQQGLSFKLMTDHVNTNASTMTVKYWSGSAWTAVDAMSDGTATGSTTLSKGGVVAFQGIAPGSEMKRAIADEFPLYYYQVTFSATLAGEVVVDYVDTLGVWISEITGIPSPPPISSYKFSEVFQNKLFLFNEKAGAKNKAVYSVTNAPDIFNGSDSGQIVFGDKTELIAAAVVYNVFTDSAVEQLLVTKKNETWRLSGDTSQNWTLKKISSNVGCTAPLTMVSAEVADTGGDSRKTVAIWVSDRGPVMSAGSAIIPIYDDIKCYWDQNDSRYIPVGMQPRSVGKYDTQTRSYKLLIASGAGATYLNTELEYSLTNKEWTKIYREDGSGANPLQSIWNVWDTNGVGYAFGGGSKGYVYRLENGNTWNGTPIASYLHTKDLILDNETPLFRRSTVKYIRTAYKKKAMGNITITHYGDQVQTTSGAGGQSGPAVISSTSTTAYSTQSTNLGNFLYHSFKFGASTSVADGMELTGFGVYFAPDTVIR